mmetsp:Transcript_81562/g.212776  ORF Transcript_81562/g.212776 Transcript_81562/m.212776 type:complete len:364 (+) Transcript_81562:103-1194(+)
MAPRAALFWLPLVGLLPWQPCGGLVLHPPHKHKKVKTDAAHQPSGKPLRQPISKIFYVNMPQSTERREAMEKALSSNSDGVPYERFEAVTGVQALTESPYIDIIKTQNTSAAFLTPNMTVRFAGSMGCYMSHRFLLEKISKLPGDEDAIYLVVEDDIDVKKGWKKRLASLWPKIPAGWDLLKLGYVGTEWPCDEIAKGVYIAKLAGGASRSFGCYRHYLGTQTYAVTKRSAARILQILYNTDVRDIDTILCTGHQCARRIPGKKTPNVYTLFDMKPHFTADAQKNSTIGHVHWMGTSAECYDSLAGRNCPTLMKAAAASGSALALAQGPAAAAPAPTPPPEYVHAGQPYVDKVLREIFPEYDT